MCIRDRDNSKFVRSAALSALQRMDGPFDMPLICSMLKDPEIEVQNKAVDVYKRQCWT